MPNPYNSKTEPYNYALYQFQNNQCEVCAVIEAARLEDSPNFSRGR